MMSQKETHKDLLKKIDELEKSVATYKRANEQNSLLLRAVEQSTEGIAVTDLDGNLASLNGTFARMHGYAPDEIIGKPLSIFHTPEQMPSVEAANQQLQKTGEFKGEIWHVRRDGTVFPTIMHNSLLRDESGQPIGMVGTLRDITDIKESEVALGQREQELRIITDNIPALVSYINTKGRYRFVNKQYEEWFDIPKKEIIGKHYKDILGKDTYDQIKDHVQTALTGHQVSYETRLPYAKGGPRWVKAEYVPDRAGGKVNGFFALVSNITERKQAEDALLKQTRLLERITNNMFDMVTLCNLEGNIIFVSKSHERILGYRSSELIGENVMAFVHTDDSKRIAEELKILLEKGNSKNVIYRYKHKKGHYLWLETTGELLKDESSSSDQIIFSTRDITERKISEQAIERERSLFKTIVNQIPVMLTRYDPDAKILFLNREFERLIGWKTEEVQNIDLMEKVYPDPHYRQKVNEYMQKATTEWKTFNVQSKSGDIIESEWSNIRLEDGTQIGIGIDVTKRKQAERESLIFKTAIDQAPVGIALADEDINIYYCNPEGLGMRGGSTDDLVEIPKDAFKNWQVYMLNGEPYEVDNLPLVRAIKTGAIIREDFIVKHQDGSSHICDAFACPVIEDNKIIGGMVIFLDITERQRTEKALEASHERLLTVLDSIDATIHVADMQNYEILFMNKYMIDSFGSDMTGEMCWKALRGESGPCSYCHNDHLVNDNGTPADVYVWQDKNPITGKWYINYDRAIEWTDGRLVKIQIATDITEMKHMEEELRQAHKMESIGTLAGGIAHEFNNMLGIIIGNTELALDDIPKWNPAADCIQEIRTASLRAKDVVRKLLSVARKTPESRKPVQIRTIVDESIGLLRKTIPASIEIISNLSCTTETILADPTEISQVLMNLCTNSAHAMVDGKGVLEVTLESKTLTPRSVDCFEDIGPGDYVKLTVSDDGKGIAPDILDRIFDPYFTTKDVNEGLGMGLAVVNGIVKKHDGAIKVESVVGRGTTVEVLFPLIDEQTIPDNEETETLTTGTERILFVDDEASLVKMVAQMLMRSGYEVVGKTSSSDAFNMFKENPDRFDLVITDMAMPKMTGDELARQIIQVRPDTPIILCTGHSDRMDESRAMELGIKAFAMKPLGKADLTNTVRKVLNDVNN